MQREDMCPLRTLQFKRVKEPFLEKRFIKNFTSLSLKKQWRHCAELKLGSWRSGSAPALQSLSFAKESRSEKQEAVGSNPTESTDLS